MKYIILVSLYLLLGGCAPNPDAYYINLETMKDTETLRINGIFNDELADFTKEELTTLCFIKNHKPDEYRKFLGYKYDKKKGWIK